MRQDSTLPLHIRALFAFIWPLLGAGVFVVIGSSFGLEQTIGLGFAGAASVSYAVGLRWYGVQGLGLRGGRPLLAGIGFAFLGWAFFLLARLFILIEPANLTPQLGQVFFYTLIFEAFCAQIWTFGLLFRAVADWRGPVVAAVASGIVYGGVGAFFFVMSARTPLALLYYVAWGLLYAFVRLRTGSLIGPVLIQALHVLTGWYVIPLPADVAPANFNTLYIVAAVFYMVIVWRLFPRRPEDIRL